MVEPLNPTPPEAQQPNYTFWSRPIEQPKANLSGEILGKGLGAALHGGAELADTVAKDVIQDDVWKRAQPITDQFVSQMIGANRELDPNYGGTTADTLFGQPKGTQPTQVANLPNRVDTLINARDNGHVSPTKFDMEIYSMAKELREKYPGFKDYVDEQISRATGVHPANNLVRNLISDYNSNVAKQNDKLSQLETKAMPFMGYPHVRDAWQNWKTKSDANSRLILETAIMDAAQLESGLKLSNLKYENADKETKNYKEIASWGLSDYANGEVASNLKTLTIPFRNKQYTLDQWLDDERTGKLTPPTSEESIMIRQWFDQRELEMRNKFIQEANRPRTDTYGNKLPPWSTAIGDVNAELSKYLAPWKQAADYFVKGDIPMAGVTMAMIKAREEDEGGRLDKSELGAQLRVISAISERVGKQNPALSAILAKPVIGLSADIQGYIYQEIGKVLQPPIPGSPAAKVQSGQTITGTMSIKGYGFNDVVENAKNKYLYGDRDTAGSSQLFATVVKRIYGAINDTIQAKQMDKEIRQRAIDALADPSNANVLNNFKSDIFTPEGKIKPGAESLFGAGYSSQTVAAVKKYGTPDQWDGYVLNANTQATTLIRDDIVQLSNLAKDLPNAIGYNPDTGTFHVELTPGSTSSYNRAYNTANPQNVDSRTLAAQQTVARVNRVMLALQNVYQHTGQDVSGEFLHMLQRSGGEEGLLKTFADAVRNSQKKKTENIIP